MFLEFKEVLASPNLSPYVFLWIEASKFLGHVELVFVSKDKVNRYEETQRYEM